MLAAAPVAPAVPSLAAAASITGLLLIIGLGFVLTYVALRLYDYTVGRALEALADGLNRIPFASIGDRTAGALDDAIRAGLQAALSAQANAASRLLSGLTWVVETTYDAMADGFWATFQAIEGIVHGEIPRQIEQRVGGSVAALRRFRRAMQAELAQASRLAIRRMRALEAELDRTFGIARRGIDAISGVTVPALRRELAGARASIGALRRHVYGRLERRLSRVEKAVLGAALAGTVLAVLTRYFPWWRCSNTRGFMRGLCRAPIGALDNLLMLLLAVTTSFGVVEFARLMQEIAEPVATAVHGVVDDD